MSRVLAWLNKKKETMFFGVIFLFGLLFVFLVPPFQKADENAHFLRAVALSDGQFSCLLSQDSEKVFLIPKAYFDYINKVGTNRIAFKYEQKFRFNSISEFDENQLNKTETVDYKGYCSLSFPAYIPTAIAIFLGESIGSISLSLYLGRLVSFALFFGSIIWSYKKIKSMELRYVLIAYALIPMVLHQVTSFGYDALTLTITPIIFSILVLTFKEKGVSKQDLIRFLLAVILLLVSKPGYYFLALLYFLIPKNKITSNNKSYIVITVFYMLGCIGSALLFARIYHENGGYIGSTTINPLEQLKLITNPLFLLKLIRNTLNTSFYFYLESFIGKFGWLDYGLPFSVYMIYIASWISLIFKLKTSSFIKIPFSKTLFLGFILLITIGFIFGSIYLTWNAVGSTVITGVQGRYFLVLFPFLVLFSVGLLQFLGEKKKFKFLLLLFLILYLLLEITFSIYKRYYDYTQIEPMYPTLVEKEYYFIKPVT